MNPEHIDFSPVVMTDAEIAQAEYDARPTPSSCPSSHGSRGMLAGTTYDTALGVYVCPCGRQYHSALPRPDTIMEVRSYDASTIDLLSDDDNINPNAAV